jgi:hypothetical protein
MFTLTIYFIVLNVYVEFDLIYRPHPVCISGGGGRTSMQWERGPSRSGREGLAVEGEGVCSRQKEIALAGGGGATVAARWEENWRTERRQGGL